MQDEEVGVSLKDVLTYCFLHWRSAIVIVLVGAVLGAGYYGFKSRPVAVPVDVIEEEEAAADTSESVALALDTQRENVILLGDYLESSLLMKVDPSNEFVSQASVLISADGSVSSTQLDALAVSYANAIIGSTALDELADDWDTTSAYLRELLTVSDAAQGDYGALSGASATNAGSSSLTTIIHSDDSTWGTSTAALSVVAIGSTAEEASSVRDAALAGIDESQVSSAGGIAEHAVVIADLRDYTAVDYWLLQTQVDRANAVSVASTNLTNNEKNAPAIEEEVTTAAAGGISKKALLKGAVLGGAAAFLLYGFILCLRYVLDASPVMRGQIEARYSLPAVGSYAYGSEAFYRGATGFDRWLRRLSGLEDPADPTAVAEMIAANVRLYAEDATTVLVSSSVGAGKASALVAALSEKLDDRSFVLANELVSSADARGQLKAADAVIFVEEYGKSTYEGIDAEITLAVETGKAPLGLVMA